MTWAPTETQKTIYEILSTDVALQTLLGGTVSNNKIYDSVPDESPYPYVKLSIKPTLDRGNHDWDGVSIEYVIDVWYRAPGQGDLKVQQIQSRIDELLHNTDICIDGWEIIVHRRSSVNILDEPDGRTKHGVQSFKLFLGRI
jgi:Protein of unknown function (DUF3168)